MVRSIVEAIILGLAIFALLQALAIPW